MKSNQYRIMISSTFASCLTSSSIRHHHHHHRRRRRRQCLLRQRQHCALRLLNLTCGALEKHLQKNTRATNHKSPSVQVLRLETRSPLQRSISSGGCYVHCKTSSSAIAERPRCSAVITNLFAAPIAISKPRSVSFTLILQSIMFNELVALHRHVRHTNNNLQATSAVIYKNNTIQ